MLAGEIIFIEEPKWNRNEITIENVINMAIVGVNYNNNLKNIIHLHVDSRIQKCYRSYYSLRDVGFSLPIKSYLHKINVSTCTFTCI